MAARFTAYIVVAIVAGTFIAGLIVGAQRDDLTGPVDLIIHNARVYTGEGPAEAVAVRGNQILHVGSDREIKRLRRPQTVYLDAGEGAVLPGFNDAHLHLLSGGLALDRVNLLGAVTLAEIQEAIRAFADAHPERPWVLGRGWYYEPFPRGLPTRQQLDAVVPDRPAYLVAYDGHTGWANSRALEIAGITRDTPDPANGMVVKDPRTGEPTGVLKEAAMGLVSRVLPPVSRDQEIAALRSAVAEAHRLGITSVQNASGTADEFALYNEIRRSGELRLRVYSALSIRPGLTEADLYYLDAIREAYPDDPVFRLGAVKLMVDGVIESHTAAMLAPYANRASAGPSNYTPDELKRIVGMLDRRGWQVVIHAIGDRGVRMALDAFEHAIQTNPPSERERRHRIEHIETIDPQDVERFAALGVIASMQPFHANPSSEQIGVWEASIGPLRASRGWAHGSLAAAHARLAFGSDWPVVALDPLLGLNMAVNRTTPTGHPPGGWNPDERLPLTAAIDAYTSGAAYAAFDEHRKGRIAPGMLADLVVLSHDVFSLPPERLLDASVAATVFDGTVVYRRADSATERPTSPTTVSAGLFK